MDITETIRAVSSVTVSRTSSLREANQHTTIKEDKVGNDNGVLIMNKRSLSNDKMSSDSLVPVFLYQRGSSLRHVGKSTVPVSSSNSNSHHPFQIIKPIETSPRTSECCIDSEPVSNVKVSSQRLKFKHRSQISAQGGPLIPDHNLMKDPPRDNIIYTPRPPLVKRFSSDQDETNSDIDVNQSSKTLRSYVIHSAPKPPISPTRGIGQAPKATGNSTANHVDKDEKPLNNVVDGDTSEIEELPNSDCETQPQTSDLSRNTKHRSSLRKGSDSPNQSDAPGRGSPSPSKSVKWNLTAEVKKIPRSRSLNGKIKSSRSRSSKSGSDKNGKISITDQSIVESHETFIGNCTSLIRQQASLIDKLRHDKISVSSYKNDLADFLDHQSKLVRNLQHILDNSPPSLDNNNPVSKL